MSLQQLFDHLDDLIRTPEDVARLEAAILQLAVRGKLTRQEEGDEPVDLLVKRIRAKRATLQANGQVDRQRNIDPVQPGDYPFDLPEGWRLVRLSELASKLGAGSTPLGGKAVYVTEGIKFIRSQNVWNDGLYLDDIAYITASTHERMANTVVKPGDLLLNITGASIGRSAIVPDDFDEANVSQHVAIVRLVDPAIRQFIHLCLISPYVQATIHSVEVGISREGLSMSRLQHFVLPLPPLPEQRRIVAKVDELLAQTRALAANLRRAQAEIVTANLAALHRLETAEDGASLQAAWRTLADSFDLLYDDPRPLAALRQAILQLAVRGKLTRQEEGDERVKNSSSVSGNDANFHLQASDTLPRVEELPKGWRLHQLQSCFRFIDYRGKTPAKTESGMRLITAKNVKQGFLADAPKEYVKPDIYDSWMTRGIPSPNAVLFTTEAPLGNVAVLDTAERIVLAQRIIALEPRAETIYSRYALYALMSSLLRNQIQRLATGTTAQGIKASRLKLVLLPVPPLVEQKRIAAKVNELMSMCDALERRLCQAEEVRQAAVESVLAHI